MLGGLVEYETSEGESDAEEGKEEAEKPDVSAQLTVGSSGNAGAPADSSSSSDSENDAGGSERVSEGGADDDALSAMASADDQVEESLRMRIPASAATRTPVLPPNPHLAGLVRPAAGGTRLQPSTKRRLLLLDPTNGAGDDSDDDEDAVKRRRVVSATAAANEGRMRGATSLLARLPKPKALAVREGASRIFVPAQAARKKGGADTAAPTPPVPMLASRLQPLAEVEDPPEPQPLYQHQLDLEQQQEQMLGSILPARELSRYRQATGASLTADNAVRDIRQADQVGDADLRMTKELTRDAGADPRRKPTGPAPSSMDKRKHQITFLAYQAQERELELKNSWADARFNQRNSQNKYGF